MTHPTDQEIRRILEEAQVIAVVGHSDKSHRTSYRVANYLRSSGYTVYPVNPTIDEVDGQTSYPSLTEVPEPIDIVNVFRRSEYLPEVFEEAIAVRPKVIWTQLDVIPEDDALVQRAEEAGIEVIIDMCTMAEHNHLKIDPK